MPNSALILRLYTEISSSESWLGSSTLGTTRSTVKSGKNDPWVGREKSQGRIHERLRGAKQKTDAANLGIERKLWERIWVIDERIRVRRRKNKNWKWNHDIKWIRKENERIGWNKCQKKAIMVRV